MDCASRGILLLAAASLLVACGRAPGDVIAPTPDTYSRASGASSPPADEVPRDAAATATRPATTGLSPLAISDAVIAGRIKAAILVDPLMAGADVSVITDHGVVILAGAVKSHEQSGIASAHAQRQDGVMRVDNQLTPAIQ